VVAVSLDQRAPVDVREVIDLDFHDFDGVHLPSRPARSTIAAKRAT
jgi:hypothetical protein